MSTTLFALLLTTGLAAPDGSLQAPLLVSGQVDASGTPTTLPLVAVDIEAELLDFVAETRVTLTFANPYDRALEAELHFPLPEGATVSGYALDVNGALVDGVVIEKERARVVFEQEVKKGVDPGLVEWVKGNNYRMRIYPMPAHGRRTVAVRYVTSLAQEGAASLWRLPLGYTTALEQFSAKVLVRRPGAAPSATLSGQPLLLTASGANFEGQRATRHEAAQGDLVVRIPRADKAVATVERFDDGEHYFCINDSVTDTRTPAQREAKAVKRLAVLWDASGSRATLDKTRELAVLRRYLALHANERLEVDLVAVRQAPTLVKHLQLTGKLDALERELASITYDGGTQLGRLLPSALAVPDLYLLFSDGLSDYGSDEPAAFKAPLYALSSDPRANHALLRQLAAKSGGEYLNLGTLGDEQAAARLGLMPYQVTQVSFDARAMTQVYPRLGEPVQAQVLICGKLLAEQAELTIGFGLPGDVQARRTYVIAGRDAEPGTLVARLWAQQRVEELSVLARRNEQSLVALGKRFGLVTPGTSLIVLERLEQYVEHHVRPPASLAEMRTQYDRQVEAARTSEQSERQSRLEQVVTAWQERVTWWETVWKPKPKPTAKKHGAEPQRAEGQGGLGLGASGQGLGGGGAGANIGLGARGGAPDEAVPEARPRPTAAPSARAARSRDADERERTSPSDDLASSATASTTPREEAKKSESSERPAVVATPQPSIEVAPWDPETPYVQALKKAGRAGYLATYLEQKRAFGASPAFYLDCAELLLKAGERALGLQVLSNVAELDLGDAALLRVLAHRLAQLGELEVATTLFEEVLRLRPEEPQSHRDLALVLALRHDYARAAELLLHVAITPWKRTAEIELIALMELNALLPKLEPKKRAALGLDPRLQKLLDVDVRIVVTWDTDSTDIDLWVIEPSGEKVYYQNPQSAHGGHISQDITDGYGPEEYAIRRAPGGTYTVQANYYGSSAQTLSGAVTVQAELITNFGRASEQRRAVTLRLTEAAETFSIGALTF